MKQTSIPKPNHFGTTSSTCSVFRAEGSLYWRRYSARHGDPH
ncbi:MAG: hypothetical protein ABIM16_02620 [Ginsengibacter sp.]